MTAPIIASCGCGATYTLETWLEIHDVGAQAVPEYDGQPAELYSLRNCKCGSTLAVAVGPVVDSQGRAA